ncbi:hypothetical protein [Embleya scabrispora]|nr:hypothetical protein [Embleya scabrispora]
MSRRKFTHTVPVSPIGRLDPVLSAPDRVLRPDAVLPAVTP